MKLREIYISDMSLLTEREKLPRYALAKLAYNFARADEKNLNNREYPEKILAREIAKKNEELKTQKISGQLEHPLSGFTELNKAMHLLNAVSYDPSTKLASAESYVLDTTGGANFMTLLDSGLKMGASMRGFGSVGDDGKVSKEYHLEAIDFVLGPSFGSDAEISASNLIESANDLLNDRLHKAELIKQSHRKVVFEAGDKNALRVEKMLEYSYSKDVDAGRFAGSLEDYRKEHEIYIEAAILQVEEDLTLEEALEKLGAVETLKKLKQEEKHIVTAKDVWLEARIMGVSAVEYAKKINEQRARETTDTDKRLFAETRLAAGPSVSNEDVHATIQKIKKQIEERKEPKTEAQILYEKFQSEGMKNVTLESVQKLLKAEEDRKAKITFLVNERRLAGGKGIIK